MKIRNRWFSMMALAAFLIYLAGCASPSNPGGLTEREVGGLTGAGFGAGTGAIIGSATGNAAAGTAIGLPIGLAAGALIGEGMRQTREEARQAAREEVMAQLYGSSTPSVRYVQTDMEKNFTKYNPKTGQRFPDQYMLDPMTGDKLEFIK
ncbi:MAG: hypothetical protein COV74_07070 [Candidatus Omnitrophica bacterium CG11_big_fil_rev_8_21_14_0_20_45_26]|uniref:Glycine zipper domain-containing protein n=1 Tax=Candidatus Abzuiibacterium crystallinum TaxID=1974748 RepID=A0A2H0LNA8_9BACT|nr:MAG: hypothetical protein COV74_07070 [Candidatus Omnitrophica bacterium CG11_big_fil_rev_8_21_14_0_20_45_26]PIW63446.1 MAG: hypothetical protein COW12_10410 [Candidatus Omnitrophica bacterium CG12_big_fil_rev_8_21_14_0_65_45_16]